MAAKPIKFVMARDFIVATKKGHTIDFKKGVPTHVPKECYTDVQAAGAVPEDVEELSKQQADPEKTVEPEAGTDERKDAIFAAFSKLTKRQKRGDFQGNGQPALARVKEFAGFDIDAHERDALWKEFQQSGKLDD